MRKELEELYDIDQNARKNLDWNTVTSPEESVAMSKKMMAIDSLNQTKILPILEEYGWLPKSKVGEKAARALFYVVQHSNSKTIEKYLPQMEALAKQGESNALDAAKMRDRLLMFQGKKQMYGTQAAGWVRPEGGQVIWPIEDVKNVNKRRKEIGFTTTVEEDAKRLGAEFNPKEELPKKKSIPQN
ncbi:DUF6624 domain-containing protein [Rufibacter glacialis]|uniref:DUF6624 domain-containing protein n=1 Tax=Rufibacter glacialis TaxID=1259555 RepID=A0A5M8QEL8_9BACT|nr:DUF6624 domain-containing protein [Rufibacter glacialis]KAA6434449.1 hypothetical protein FOE74_09650 [Rufibacter glacialis]GGK69741.1 hypothetical protein GCM10011405_17220 [Rufibacter glacialis]